ncbi:MAG: hypothetical protein CMK59_01865 [Proteobacteria bacterium]|nr:hypothetical protein [Pseudomonadota bacterium]
MTLQTELFLKEQYTQFECPEIRSGWHLNRRYYSVWIVPLPNSIVHKIKLLQDAFKPWIIPMHSPHITVSACGFPSEDPQYSDDVSTKTIQEQADQLKKYAPFNLRLDGLSSFLNGPIVQISPSPDLLNMNECLTQKTQDFRSVPYSPHICLGLYKKPYPTTQIFEKMKDLTPLSFISWQIQSIELADFEASDPTARLYTKKIIHLSK